MISEYVLPQYLWTETTNTSCYIENQIYFCKNSNKTPFEIYYSRKSNVSYFKVFGCKYFGLNTKGNLGKFDPKSFEAIFVGYSNTCKAYKVFNRSTLTIEEFIHVKFEESNSLVKNIVEIDSLGENFEKISMKDSPAQDEEEKPKDDTNREFQDVEVELAQPLPKDWRYATSHPKNLIIGDVS